MFTDKRLQELKETYLFVFDVFATDRSEVADHFGISKNAAKSRLKTLQRYGLADCVDVNDEAQGLWKKGLYKELTWQTFLCIDDYSHEEAEIYFDDTMKGVL